MKAPTMEFLSKADVVDIDESTKAVLENVGLLVNHAEARELFKKAGCEVDEKTKVVKIPRSLVDWAVSVAPTHINLCSRDGKKDVQMRGDGSTTLFSPIGFGTKVTEYLGPSQFKTRDSTTQDITNLAKIVDACDHIDYHVQGISAMDLMLAKDKNRHVREFDATMVGTSKTFLWDTHAEDLADCVKIQTAVYGGDEEESRKKPFFMNVSCTTSPLQLDYAVCDLCLSSAEFNVPMMVMTMGMCGTSAPIHIAGTLVENNAEVLGGIVLSQLARKGAPNLYGSCTTNFDFHSNSAPFGSPEATLISSCVAQLVNFYGVPSIVAGCVSDSKYPDVQSGHETTMNTIMPTLSGAGNLTGAGMIELGMSHSFEQLIIDNDLFGVVRRLEDGVVVNAETMMIDEIIATGPTGDYVSHPSTLEYFGSVSNPEIVDHCMYDEWMSMGALDAMANANDRVVDIMNNHQVAPVDPDIRRDIDAIIKAADAKYTA